MKSLISDMLQARLAIASADAAAPVPMNKRLYDVLRQAILDGFVAAGARLPASRDLAQSLGIARNTVTHVYEQLAAEGYTASRQGSGTYVTDSLPDVHIHAVRQPVSAAGGAGPALLSERGARIVRGVSALPYRRGAFMPGEPDVTEFPHRKFGRILASLWRNPKPEWLSYSYGGGLLELRRELAHHLALTRSIDCEPDQILITEGSHQAIDLATRLLGNPGDAAWIENPSYWGARTIFEANGLRAVSVPVDQEGMCLSEASRLAVPRLIFVTPSHQYPLGAVMSLARRRQLLAIARQSGSWIIEDDYDSEFRFSGHPISSLQGLEPDAPVVYLGTFSKTLYPGLRIGYLVLPKALTGAFQAAHAELYREGHLITQAALAAFISQGHYAAHIRRMRLIYGRRRAILVNLIQRRLGAGWLHEDDSDAGLHLVLNLPDGMDDRQAVEAARRRGILTRALSRYYAGDGERRNGLLLGYGCVDEQDIVTSFELLLAGLSDVAKSDVAKSA